MSLKSRTMDHIIEWNLKWNRSVDLSLLRGFKVDNRSTYLWHQYIHGCNCLSIIIKTHIESFDILGIIVHYNRFFVYLFSQIPIRSTMSLIWLVWHSKSFLTLNIISIRWWIFPLGYKCIPFMFRCQVYTPLNFIVECFICHLLVDQNF